MLNYGVVLHNRGEFDQAVKYLRQAVAKHPRQRARALLPGRSPGPLRGSRSSPEGPALGDHRQPDEPDPGSAGPGLRAAARRGGVPGPGGARALLNGGVVRRTGVEMEHDRGQADEARQRRVLELLDAGVALDDPSTTHLGGEVVVESGARLRPFTILEGRTVIRKGAVGRTLRSARGCRGRSGSGDPRPLPAARVPGGGEGDRGAFRPRAPAQPHRSRCAGRQLRRVEEGPPGCRVERRAPGLPR